MVKHFAIDYAQIEKLHYNAYKFQQKSEKAETI